MSYEISLHLVDVQIKSASVPVVSRAFTTKTGRGLVRLRHFLELAVIDSEGFLAFKATEDESDVYVPDDEGTVPALSGKWAQAESVARWLSRHSEEGGRLICHSREGDGAAWGWEFDGTGRMRRLDLAPVSEWE